MRTHFGCSVIVIPPGRRRRRGPRVRLVSGPSLRARLNRARQARDARRANR